MRKYIVKRILLLIPIALCSSLLIFSLMSLTGDPAWTIVGENGTQEEYLAVREALGLDDPLLVRYTNYMKGVIFERDLGQDIYGRSVWDEYMQRLPSSLILALVSVLLTVVLAVPLGILAAIKQNSPADFGLSAVAIVGMSVPNFWLGLMLIILFSLNLGWLPTSGAEDGIRSIILPAIASSVSNIAVVSRMTRSSMLDCLRADYLRTARAKGVREKAVVVKHALGNALIPILTSLSNQFAILIGGSVIVETVFAWPGVGNMIITAVKNKDATTVTGGVMMTTVIVAVILLLVDILYAYVDPRIKAKYQGK